MRQFTETADIHAQQRHGLQLSWDAAGLGAVDQILDRERTQGDLQERGALALCYGCWLGEFAAKEYGAQWIGMHEPEPPRLQVAGVICSPIDAVARRLENAAAPPLAQRMAEMQNWVASYPSASASLRHNQHVWEQLAIDPRFANFTGHDGNRLDRDTAEAAIDPWLRELPLAGRDLLCLAAGGGTHALLHAVAGARVTVVDVSEPMLAIDRRLAEMHDLPMTTVLASMDALTGLNDASFDVVLQPVSTCYLPDVVPVYVEVARVLRDGGQYVVQHKQPGSLQAEGDETAGQYRLRHPAFSGRCVRGDDADHDKHLEAGAMEFIHPLETLLGGLCKSGFHIEDVQEPPRADIWSAVGTRQHRACYLPPYLKLKARRLPR